MSLIPRYNYLSTGAVVASGLTRYFNGYLTVSATEATRQIKIYEAVTISKLEVVVSANTIATSATTVRTRVAGANGNMSVSIAAGATGLFQDASNTDTFSGTGELFCFQAVTPATSGSITINAANFAISTTSGTTNFYATRNGNAVSNNVSRFHALDGGGLVWPSEAATQTKMKVAGTFKNMNMYIETNARAVTDTYRLRVNGANSNPVITITSGQTGFFEDASNTAATVVDDLVNFTTVFGASGGSVAWGIESAITFVTTAGKTMVIQSLTSQTINKNLTRYLGLQGDGGPSATEAFVQGTALQAGTFSNLTCYIFANTVTAASTLNFRKNGASGNQSVSITASTTGLFTDASNTDTVVGTDTVNLMLTTGATGTSMDMPITTMLFTAPAIAVGSGMMAFF